MQGKWQPSEAIKLKFGDLPVVYWVCLSSFSNWSGLKDVLLLRNWGLSSSDTLPDSSNSDPGLGLTE